MKLIYLGTAAFEGIPAIFCSCPICNEARILGKRNIRTRSQAIVNDDLLIDFNPDTFTHFLNNKYDIRKIKDCLITHAHSDHFYPEDIEMARKDFVINHNKINYYGGETVFNKLQEIANKPYMDGVITASLVKDNEIIKVGKYDVLPLNANHAEDSTPFIYLISDGNKKMLYGNDTGEISLENYEKMKKFGHLDLISLDCTGGIQTNWRGHHMSLDVCLEVIEKMKKEKIIDEKTILVINHFSHNGKCNYDKLQEICKKYNIIVSYDGLEIEF